MFYYIMMARAKALGELWSYLEEQILKLWAFIRTFFPPKYQWEFICECGTIYSSRFKRLKRDYTLNMTLYCPCQEWLQTIKVEVPALESKYIRKQKPKFYDEKWNSKRIKIENRG